MDGGVEDMMEEKAPNLEEGMSLNKEHLPSWEIAFFPPLFQGTFEDDVPFFTRWGYDVSSLEG